MRRVEARRHRFAALALAWQQQAGAITAQRGDPVGMADDLAQRRHVGLEPDLTAGIGRNRRGLEHALLYGVRLHSYNQFSDTVRVYGAAKSHHYSLTDQSLGFSKCGEGKLYLGLL